MSRIKIMLAGLLAMLIVGSVASAVASAAPDGPWFRHPEGGKQVKWPINEEQQIKSKNQGGSPFILKSTISENNTPVTLECRQVNNKGNIWNGLHQGEDEAEVIFSECIMSSAPCAGEPITVEPTKVYTELMWKYSGVKKELEEQKAGQQKIYDVFASTAEPVGGKAKFTTIKIPAKCIFGGSINVEAGGTAATFVDQHQVSHSVVWGTAAEVNPQNLDAKTGYLVWNIPNQKQLHHQGTIVQANLFLGTHTAELQGQIKIERNNEEEFGVFNE